MPRRVATDSSKVRKRRPALNPEARQNQLISLAIDLVEQRLIDGTASSQETTHFLKLASEKSRLETEIMAEQKEFIKAKAEAIRAAKRMDEIYEEALNAMRKYSGSGGNDEY